jgi:WD40-like Beta Propeller Repeat
VKAEAGMASLGRGRTLRSLIGAIVFGIGVVALLALAAAPSQAASKRVFEETFGSAAQPEFGQPQGMAVDHGSGDLYVIDVEGDPSATPPIPSVSRWHSNGTSSPFPALGTNVIDGQRTGAVNECPTVPADCDETPQNGFDFPPSFEAVGRSQVQVAIDESGTATDGNIYVTQINLNLIDIFAADGHFLGQLTKYKEGEHAEGPEVPFPGSRGPCGVAVDQHGALYVGDLTADLVHKYVLQGVHNPPVAADNVANFAGLDQPCTMAAGAGPSDGYLFVNAAGGSVYKLDSSTGAVVGEPLVDNPSGGGSTGDQNTVSVSPESGNVFFGFGFGEIKEVDASGAEPVEVSSTVPASFVMGFAPAPGDRLYVAREGGPNVEVFSAPLPSPVVVTNPATNVTETSATLNGTIARQGLATEACSFEYIADAAYQANKAAKANLFSGASSQACAESNAEIDAGAEPFPVHTDLAGLAAGELFHFRLSATTLAGTVAGNEQTFATTVPPTIEGEQASAITDTEATIKLVINPEFYATSFHIEYGPGSFALSTLETFVGSDGADHLLVVSLTGLIPGTTYEWRIVASSANGLSSESAAHSFTTYRPFVPDTACANQGLRNGPSSALPDCRAYEMVSPVDKNGEGIIVRGNLSGEDDAYIQATPDGGKITYSSAASFGDQLSSLYYNQYIAARGAASWATSGVNPPLGRHDAGFHTERFVSGFSEDLCSMWLVDYNTTPLNPDAQADFNNLYRRQNCAPGEGSFETLTTTAPLAPPPGPQFVNNNSVQGFSADGKAAFFVAKAPLTPEAAPTDRDQIYLHLADDPAPRLPHLVSILPDGTAAAPAEGSDVGSGLGPLAGTWHNAVSADGRRVFWTARVPGADKIYLRENPAAAETTEEEGGSCVPHPTLACTIEVSAGGDATYWDASRSGSAALYSEGSLGSGTADLYSFDVATQTRTKLAGKVYGVAGAGDDLARIYLVSGEDRDGAGPAAENQPNLYLYEGGSFTFVATLPAIDLSSQTFKFSPVSNDSRNHATRVSADGRHLLFQSRAPLTGFDNSEAGSGEAAMEVFLYEAGGALRCVSCNPAGIRPLGDDLPKSYYNPHGDQSKSGVRAAAWIPTWQQPLHPSRLLSEDGNRAFFHSFDPLLPGDTNGTVQDVYQWEAPGTGSCDPGDANYFPQNGGCIDLISTGESSEVSSFSDADADGSDVFFTTESRLVPQDPGLVDLYDARIGGGYPPPVTPAICEGEACQSPPPPPAAATPATAAHRGPGNLPLRRNCRPAARRAARLSRQARRLRRAAKQAADPAVANRLHRKARSRAAQAKRKSRAAKRCRRANRRAAR